MAVLHFQQIQLENFQRSITGCSAFEASRSIRSITATLAAPCCIDLLAIRRLVRAGHQIAILIFGIDEVPAVVVLAIAQDVIVFGFIITSGQYESYDEPKR